MADADSHLRQGCPHRRRHEHPLQINKRHDIAVMLSHPDVTMKSIQSVMSLDVLQVPFDSGSRSNRVHRRAVLIRPQASDLQTTLAGHLGEVRKQDNSVIEKHRTRAISESLITVDGPCGGTFPSPQLDPRTSGDRHATAPRRSGRSIVTSTRKRGRA